MSGIICVVALVLFVGFLIAVAVKDIKELRIPNSFVCALLGVWFIERISLAGVSLVASGDAQLALNTALSSLWPWQIDALQGVVGALVLGGGAACVSVVYEAIAHKPSMGGGDVKLLFAVGLYLGWERGLMCLLIACVLALLCAAALAYRGRHLPEREQPFARTFPFAPAITCGALLALVL